MAQFHPLFVIWMWAFFKQAAKQELLNNMIKKGNNPQNDLKMGECLMHDKRETFSKEENVLERDHQRVFKRNSDEISMHEVKTTRE